MSLSVDKIIETWRVAHGNRFHANERLTQILQLIKTLADNGYGEDSLGESFKRKVIEICTNKNSKKVKVWREMVEKDISEAIVQFYPGPELSQVTQEDIKIRSNELKVIIPRFDDKKAEITISPAYERVSEDLDRSVFQNTPTPEAPVSEADFWNDLGSKSDD